MCDSLSEETYSTMTEMQVLPQQTLLPQKNFNSIIFTNKARTATTDIENFYLNNDLPESEWMKLPLEIIPDGIIQQYNLKELSDNEWVYIEILKAMYGLKQVGKIAYDELVKHLKPFGYSPTKYTPGYWRHKTKPISFILCVDDFAVKYTNENDLNHLLQVLKTKYTITIVLTGRLYRGISLNWNYDKNYVDISMPGYVQSALHKFQHHPPRRRQHAPHP